MRVRPLSIEWWHKNHIVNRLEDTVGSFKDRRVIEDTFRLRPVDNRINALLPVTKIRSFPERAWNLPEIFLPLRSEFVAPHRLGWRRASQRVQHPVDHRSCVSPGYQTGLFQSCQFCAES